MVSLPEVAQRTVTYHDISTPARSRYPTSPPSYFQRCFDKYRYIQYIGMYESKITERRQKVGQIKSNDFQHADPLKKFNGMGIVVTTVTLRQ